MGQFIAFFDSPFDVAFCVITFMCIISLYKLFKRGK